MANYPNKTAQIHVRVSRELKKALKMHCVRQDTTEQDWISKLVAGELARKAPDLWPEKKPASKKMLRRR